MHLFLTDIRSLSILFSMSPLKIAVIIGSTRPNRFGDKPAHWIAEQAKKLENVDVELLDLRDFPMPFYDEPMGASSLNKQYTDDVVQKWSSVIDEKDAFIIVAPEYNHGTSAVLKNALDHLYPEWSKKPVAFVSYGGVGGARAVEHLRLVAIELEMVPLRNAIHIPGTVLFPILSGDRQWTAETEAALKKQADGLLSHLQWWGNVLKEARMI
jgi:NAD(P)H-dependent FMN reductase